MDSLIKTLPAVLRAAGDSELVAEAACFAAWNHTIGEGLRNNVAPIAFEQRTLVVAVRDSIWQRQLATMLGQLIARVNFVLGQQLVKTIELRIQPESIKAAERHHPAMNETRVVPEELLFAANRISDPNLRRAFLGAAAKRIDGRW
jgi:hypothetical protein